MKTRTCVVLQLAALALVLAACAMADDNGYLYVVHGIPGRDVTSTINPGFPVDLLINGKTCIARGLTFGNSYGPYTLAAGTYDIAISEANNLAGCTNPAIVTGSVTLTAGESVSAVTTLNAGAPALLTYTDDLSSVGQGTARFVFVNSGDEPALKVTLAQEFGKSPKTYTVTVNSEAQKEIAVPSGPYLIKVTAQGGTIILAEEELGLPDQSVSFVYAAGESANATVTLINRAVRDVF